MEARLSFLCGYLVFPEVVQKDNFWSSYSFTIDAGIKGKERLFLFYKSSSNPVKDQTIITIPVSCWYLSVHLISLFIKFVSKTLKEMSKVNIYCKQGNTVMHYRLPSSSGSLHNRTVLMAVCCLNTLTIDARKMFIPSPFLSL